jgi:glucose/arabinose dehydrogenase
MKAYSMPASGRFLGTILALLILLVSLLPSGSASAAGTVIPKNIKFVPVVGGLSDPLFVTHAGDGTDRLFIVERTGKIRIFKNDILNTKAFLDVSTMISITGGEQGLLGLAFAPDYGTSGRFYVVTQKSNNTIALYIVSSARTLRMHPAAMCSSPFPRILGLNGGMLAFGPDGYHICRSKRRRG